MKVAEAAFAGSILSVRSSDSGGVQEETTYLGIPCLTLRDTTERPVTVTEGSNRLIKPRELAATVERSCVRHRRKRKAPRARGFTENIATPRALGRNYCAAAALAGPPPPSVGVLFATNRSWLNSV